MTADRWQQVVRTHSELRDVVAPPSRLVADKVIDHIDHHAREFIAHAPFLVLASTNAAGDVDLSPKGDPPGFVMAHDEHTLLIPDRPGNHRVDTLCNLLDDDRVGLIFLIPGKGETLRISGRAQIVRDPPVLRRLTHKGRPPLLAIVVTVHRAFFHCAKCMIRSGLWNPDEWPGTDHLPSLAQTMVDHGRLPESVDAVDAIVRDDARTRLY